MVEKIPAFIISKNKRLTELLSMYLAEYDLFELQKEITGESELYNIITSAPKSLLFIDNDTCKNELPANFAEDCKNCVTVSIKENPDVTYIVSSIRMGVKEILAYPIIKSEFTDVIERILQQFSQKVNKKQDRCKMITLFSNKGGIGKTSIAANLAYELAQITKENVALIDLNFQFGDITTFMDLHPSFDISYMFENLNLLNRDFLLSTMEKYKNTTLYVLADAPYIKQTKQVSSKQVTKFFDSLKDCFSYIVVDTGASFDAKTITTLDYSDIVFLVTIVNLPALRNCQRCLNLFEKLGYDNSKVQILVNRFMENDEISIADVENVLKKKVYWKVPNNYFAQMAAINKGELISEMNPKSNISENYKDLAITVSDSVFKNRLINKYNPELERKLENILEM